MTRTLGENHRVRFASPAGPLAGKPVPPVRERVERWEQERAKIAQRIKALESEISQLQVEHDSLTHKITQAWTSRAPSLNTDVLETIFDFMDEPNLEFFYDRWPAERPFEYFRGLCLVSRQWLNPARKLLYREVPLLSPEQSRILERAVKGNAELRPMIRTIFIHTRETDIGDVFHLLSNLQAIFSDFWPSERLHDQLLAVSSMRRFGIGREVVWDRGMWSQALASWPRLETLLFQNRSGSFHPEDSLGFRPCKALKTLAWQRASLLETAVPPTLPHTIKTISIRDSEVWAIALKGVLERHLQSLVRLEITQSQVVDQRDFLDNLRLEGAKKLEYLSETDRKSVV